MKDLGGKKDNIPLVHAVVRAVDPDNGLALQDVDGLLGVRMGVRRSALIAFDVAEDNLRTIS